MKKTYIYQLNKQAACLVESLHLCIATVDGMQKLTTFRSMMMQKLMHTAVPVVAT